MSTRHITPGSVSWPLVEAGFWMRAGFAGAATALIAPALLVGGDVVPTTAAALVAGGVALAVFAYRRTRRVLDAADAPARRATPRAAGAKPIAA